VEKIEKLKIEKSEKKLKLKNLSFCVLLFAFVHAVVVPEEEADNQRADRSLQTEEQSFGLASRRFPKGFENGFIIGIDLINQIFGHTVGAAEFGVVYGCLVKENTGENDECRNQNVFDFY